MYTIGAIFAHYGGDFCILYPPVKKKQKTPKTLVNTGFFALIQDQKFFLIGTVSYVSTVSAATRPLYTAGASRYNIRESGGNGNTFPPKKEYWADIKNGQPYKTSNANFFFYRPLCRKSKKNEVKKGG